MSDRQEEIKEHYEKVKELSVTARDFLETIMIRKMNNFIKTILINENVAISSKILDIRCGKGGDFKKYKQRGIIEYYGVDISENSIEDAKKRYDKSGIRFRAKFIVADCYNMPLELPIKFDVISIQFSFHYAFSSENSLRTSLSNIKNNLKVGGKVIATVPDKETLLRRYHGNKNGYGNKYYRVEFNKSLEEILQKKEIFGVEYKFTLQDSLDDCAEYLIYMRALDDECRKIGLRITQYEPFLKYYNEHVKKYLYLHDLIVGAQLNADELKVIELYSILVIERIE